MQLRKTAIATTEMLLIFPAGLFMTALFVRNLQPMQYEPARTAQQIVAWYAARPHVALWGLLIALPVAVLASGCVTLLHRWRSEAKLRQVTNDTLVALRAHLSTGVVAVATVASAIILAIVALHMATD